MTRDEMINALKSNVCEVIFTKVDGTKRVMKCTLKEDIVPVKVNNTLTEKKIKKENVEVLSVWVPELESWRSFRVNNVDDFLVLE